MATTLVETQKEIIEKVVNLIIKKLPEKQAKPIIEFTEQIYGTVAVEDLNERGTLDLYGAILAHWNLIYQRNPGEFKVHIYNPNYEQHGWQSTHTIIEVSLEDMPFLIDSIRMEVNRQGFGVHLMIHRGRLKFKRNNKNQIVEVLPIDQEATGIPNEAFMYFEIDRVTDEVMINDLHVGILKVLNEIRMCVEDWEKMRNNIDVSIKEINQLKPEAHDAALISESKEFLSWLADNHFTFIGCREYELLNQDGDLALRAVPGTGLGILRDTEESCNKLRLLSSLPASAQKIALSDDILIITQTNTISNIHRPVYYDYIGVKRFDKDGKLIGERRFIGLYTATAYHSNPSEIPFVRHKVAKIFEWSGVGSVGHSSKELMNIIESLPRDDLFQGSTQELYDIAMGILYLQERSKIRLFVRKDAYDRFVSCLVYAPRERVNTELRGAFQEILMKAFHGTDCNFRTQFTESVLARIHYIIRVDTRFPLQYDVKEIESKLVEAGRSWQDELRQSLIDYYGEEKGNILYNKYTKAFPTGYREDFTPRTAVYDIEHMEKLTTDNPLGLSFYRPLDEAEGSLRFKLFQVNYPIPLSDVLPILENMGVKVLGEKPHQINFKDGMFIWINDFGMRHAQGATLDVEALREIFQDSFRRVWHGSAENDGFNRLVLSAQLNWRQIAVLRTYAKYLKQTGFTFSQAYIEQTFSEHPSIAKQLIDLFDMRFDPHVKADSIVAIAELKEAIQASLDLVVSLDEDRILRRYLELINATIRTNYFQKDSAGNYKSYLSLKINPAEITDLPLPRPMYEIFVYSSRFEAVHLRNAKVARGGIRWSDRREDFRTEILGLMKAQRVKNAVIVPSGAKGGFVPKCLPTDGNREALMEEVVNCYKTFIRGMLDLTDNLKNGTVVTPPDVVRYDEDDTYLVVAADKGTATFSDIANSISKEYGFWLGDAFASGGSAGYDHKKIGITARGAWESVKRHFRELGVDTQTSDFTAVGIGDMSGDVFGNGLLQSRHFKLVGAFNHQHIFIDPNPDTEASYRERKRLFELPRSTWEDYDPAVISTGGGVYKRSAKSIKLSPEAQKLLNIDKDVIVPNDLIRALLLAKVDLLWNGGIGTYVKAQQETHTDVGDRANDAIRINGIELNARVVGEGGNLGFTQLGRVEYALKGGILYTDFIDNSAGVDCSDHEVNIKILLNTIVANGDLTEKQRNIFLSEMTDEVAASVLRNNYMQPMAISMATLTAFNNTELYRAYMANLEGRGKLDRALEFLPEDKTLLERKAIGKSLTYPEIAVLFAYTKEIVKEELLASDVPEDPSLAKIIGTAFPEILVKRYGAELENHSLRREIIATQLSNSMINEMGITFVYRLYDETGAPTSAIARAYSAARIIFGLPEIWREIEALDLKVPTLVQYDMMAEVARLVRRATRWFLRHRRVRFDVAEAIKTFSKGVDELANQLESALIGIGKEKVRLGTQHYLDAGVPEALARRVARSRAMFSALDIIDASNQYGLSITDLSHVYFTLSERLDLIWFRDQINDFPVETHWDALSREAIRDDLDLQIKDLSVGVLHHKTKSKDMEDRIKSWEDRHKPLIDRWHSMVANLRGSGNLNFTKLFVAMRELLDLTQTSFHVANVTRKDQKG